MCYFGLFGIILMIIENELCFRNIDHAKTETSFFIRILISITTVMLIFLVIYYNRLTLIRYPLNSYLYSWKAELTVRKIFFILLEIFVCSIHPIPRYLPFLSVSFNTETDLILGLPSKFHISTIYLHYCFV